MAEVVVEVPETEPEVESTEEQSEAAAAAVADGIAEVAATVAEVVATEVGDAHERAQQDAHVERVVEDDRLNRLEVTVGTLQATLDGVVGLLQTAAEEAQEPEVEEEPLPAPPAPEPEKAPNREHPWFKARFGKKHDH